MHIFKVNFISEKVRRFEAMKNINFVARILLQRTQFTGMLIINRSQGFISQFKPQAYARARLNQFLCHKDVSMATGMLYTLPVLREDKATTLCESKKVVNLENSCWIFSPSFKVRLLLIRNSMLRNFLEKC